jgi:hypothetical protein
MASSGTVHIRRKGREKRYWLKKNHWRDFFDGLRSDAEAGPISPEQRRRLPSPKRQPRWLDWVHCIRAFLALVRFFRRRDLVSATEYVQMSEFRQLLDRVQPDLERGLHEFARTGRGETDAEGILASMERL